jgi:hypothetical protein
MRWMPVPGDGPCLQGFTRGRDDEPPYPLSPVPTPRSPPSGRMRRVGEWGTHRRRQHTALGMSAT